MSQDTLRVVEKRQKVKMEGNWFEEFKWRSTKKNQERQGKLSKRKMQGTGSPQ